MVSIYQKNNFRKNLFLTPGALYWPMQLINLFCLNNSFSKQIYLQNFMEIVIPLNLINQTIHNKKNYKNSKTTGYEKQTIQAKCDIFLYCCIIY